MDRLIDSLRNLKVTVTFSAREEDDAQAPREEAEFVDVRVPRDDNNLIRNRGHGAHTEVVSLMRRINWTRCGRQFGLLRRQFQEALDRQNSDYNFRPVTTIIRDLSFLKSITEQRKMEAELSQLQGNWLDDIRERVARDRTPREEIA